MKLKERRSPINHVNGYPDYFDDRHRRKMLRLARIKPRDIFYDLGCGYASILILAVKEFNVRRAIGYEDNWYRCSVAKKRIKKENLSDRISIIQKDFSEANLSNADVIFDMLSETPQDLQKLYKQKIKDGARLIKHDLPLIGYLPDVVDYPFYKMTFPLNMGRSRNEWAAKVLGKENVSSTDVWHEIFHYQFTKGYDRKDIIRLKRMLSKRIIE